jgi:cytochrome-b5 reductase
MSNSIPVVAVGVVTLVSLAAAYFYISSKASRPVLHPVEFNEFPLIQKTVLSPNSAIYRFGLPRPGDALGLPIGQHVSIMAEINGKEVMRSYTPTSSDLDKGYFDLLIKAYPNGNISKHVAGLTIGSTIKVRGPKGAFQYTPNMVKTFNMIAGGTGITPMYQIITAISRDPSDKTKVNLIYANVNEEDILLRKEIDQIAAKNPNIKVHYVLNNAPENWAGSVGFVTPDIIKANSAPPSDDIKLLLCGPPPMVSAIKKAAVDLGYEKARPVSKLEDQIFTF